MTSVSVLPVAGEVFDDARDDARFLRVSWHPADGMCALEAFRRQMRRSLAARPKW